MQANLTRTLSLLVLYAHVHQMALLHQDKDAFEN